MASAPGAPRQPRRWPRRLLIGLNIFLAVCILLVGTSYAYVKWRFGQVNAIAFAKGILDNDGDDPPGEPMNVLLVGSDSRENIGKGEASKFGSSALVGGQRSDTIMILHVDPKAEKAAILSIPRDLWIRIDGLGHNQRINIAFEGGPERLIRTITRSLDIDIDHYVEVDFTGFRGIVSAVGGVKVYFPAPARDTLSGLKIPSAGCVKLNGEQALSYVRSRHYQSYESGRWRYDPTSDFGRIQRQQDFIRRIIRKALTSRNLVKLDALAGQAVKNVTIDDTLSTKDITRLGKRFHSLEPTAVEMITLPVEPVLIGAADVLRLKQPDAQQIIDRFNGKVPDDAANQVPTNVLPAQVTLKVLNGTGIRGQAGQAAADLSRLGFGVSGTGEADSFKYIKPVIRYGTGQEDEARLLRAYLVEGAQLREDDTLLGGDLVLITGTDFSGVRSPGTLATTTSTSAPAATKPPRSPLPPQC